MFTLKKLYIYIHNFPFSNLAILSPVDFFYHFLKLKFLIITYRHSLDFNVLWQRIQSKFT